MFGIIQGFGFFLIACFWDYSMVRSSGLFNCLISGLLKGWFFRCFIVNCLFFVLFNFLVFGIIQGFVFCFVLF